MLRNPAYAGIYAYGRSRVDPARRTAGADRGRVRGLGDEQWLVRIDDALPAYISVAQYERNLARLAANRATAASVGAPRGGPGLLSGLVACATCGNRLQIAYERSKQGSVHRYVCNRRRATYGEPICQQMAGRFLDEFVVGQVLLALAPAALELSLAATARIEADRAAVDRIWAQRLERADIACDRARRCYQLAEPENRLVMRQLERDWEEALAMQAQLAEDHRRYRTTRPAHLSASELATIRALASDIPAIWTAATTTDADRKKLLHAIVGTVTVQARGTSERVTAVIHWAGGATTSADLVRPVARVDQLSYYPQLVQRLTALAADGLTVKAIAEHLEKEGLRPPHQGRRFHHGEIQHLIRRLGIRPGLETDRRTDHGELGPGQWWLATLAREIGMPQATLFTWLRRGWITGRQDTRAPYRWIITADQAEVERLKQLRSLPPTHHNRRHWAEAVTRTTEAASKEAESHDRTL